MTDAAYPAGWRVERLDETASTNDIAARLAREGAGGRFVVRAGAQTAGRGRRGRAWVSPPGNLYASYVVRPDVPSAQAGQGAFVAALAVAEAIEAVCPGLRAYCKWPNDIVADRAKVAGLLAEAEPDGEGGLAWMIFGVGVNVANCPAPEDAPDGALPPIALSVLECVPDLDRLAGTVARLLDGWIIRWEVGGFAEVRAAWLARAIGIGREIEVRLANETLSGMFEDLDEDGALMLAQDDGRVRRVTAGDVFFT